MASEPILVSFFLPLGKKQSPDRPRVSQRLSCTHGRPFNGSPSAILVSPVGAVGLCNVVLARALVVKAAPVLWIVRRFLPLSAGVENSAPGSPYSLSYHHLGLICAAHLLQCSREYAVNIEV